MTQQQYSSKILYLSDFAQQLCDQRKILGQEIEPCCHETKRSRLLPVRGEAPFIQSQ